MLHSTEIRTQLQIHMNNISSNPCLPIQKEDDDSILLEPFHYLCSYPGKGFRTMLINVFNLWLKTPEKELKFIIRVIDMLHSASLMIDDIEDNSSLRRGVPAAHILYGLPQTINSAHYVNCVALYDVCALKNPAMTMIFAEELVNLHRGQGMDIHWRESFTCPTEDQYIEMVNNKTGGLLRLAIRLMQQASESDIDYTSLMNKIGIYFQIRDDYMNLMSTKYAESKGLCEDITEGKFSFPIIHSIHSNPTDTQLLDIMKQRSESIGLKHSALRLLEKTRSFGYCRQFLAKLEAEIRSDIADFGGNVLLEKAIDTLSVPIQQGDTL